MLRVEHCFECLHFLLKKNYVNMHLCACVLRVYMHTWVVSMPVLMNVEARRRWCPALTLPAFETQSLTESRAKLPAIKPQGSFCLPFHSAGVQVVQSQSLTFVQQVLFLVTEPSLQPLNFFNAVSFHLAESHLCSCIVSTFSVHPVRYLSIWI